MFNKSRIADEVHDLGLKKFGWDEHDALPIREDVVRTCTWIFGSDSSVSFSRIDTPAISLNADGTVEFAWMSNNVELLLTVQCDMTVTYVKVFRGATEEGTIRRVNEDGQRALHELFWWLATPRS